MSDLIPYEDGRQIAPQNPLDENPATVYLASLISPRSRRVQMHALNAIASMLSKGVHDLRSFPWVQLRYQHVTAVRTALAEHYAPATANRMLAALRRVIQECWRLGYLDADEYRRASDVSNIKSETLPAGRSLSSGEISALIGTCAQDGTPAGARDAAMIAILYGSGLRRAEIVGLQFEDYDPETGQITIRGKGRKERTAYVIEGAAAALADWLDVRGAGIGSLFCAINRHGTLQDGSNMTAQAVYNMLQKRGKAASVKAFSPHDLRRTFVSDMLDAGADIATVAEMAGHASPVTTMRYDRRGERAKQKAASLIHIPYTGRRL